MFRKIVSNLSFSPALVGQLGFYAKRLRKEETTRRMGLVFVALALVVQSLAVFQPPESANASNTNDFVPGGLGLGANRSLNNFLSPYDSNNNNVQFTELKVNSTEMIAYPNPFGKQTTVRFTLPYQEDHATLDIYDLKGVKIQTLFNGNANAQTTYEVQFNGQNLSAGTYFFRLITAKEVKSFQVVMSNN
jgi:hypothetical protein